MSVAQPRFKTFYDDATPGREPRVARARALAAIAGLLLCACAAAMIVLGALTLFRARRLYAACATRLSRAILWLYGVDVEVHGPAWPTRQTVYVSNHTSSLDLFVLVALGLPNTRFFLSGFLRRILPLGIVSTMMGTFFTVPQDQPEERRRIFARAAAVLRRTGESVYLSPEGERITTGTIGRFNKGAFHLATDLRVPIQPFYIAIPPDVDPKRGIDVRPGTVHVFVMPAVSTADWTVDEASAHKERVRDMFVEFQRSAEALVCL